MPAFSHFLLAYFLSEEQPDGEQIRFAVSQGPEPTAWTLVNDGAPVLCSNVGEKGARDPFLVRDAARGEFTLLATDLRVGPDGDWKRAVQWGSRDIVVWRSRDLTRWCGPRSVRLAPPNAGNAWAPKAFWSVERGAWLVFWASSLFAETDDERAHEGYQRILVAETSDFERFTPARIHIDQHHDVIDLTFVEHAGLWYRFSVDSERGHHLFEEVGTALEDRRFRRLAVNVGHDVMVRAEGPAVAKHPFEERWYLLADEFGLRGYQLFDTTDLSLGLWDHRPDARLPDGARHGSLLAITTEEHDRVLCAEWH